MNETEDTDTARELVVVFTLIALAGAFWLLVGAL